MESVTTNDSPFIPLDHEGHVNVIPESRGSISSIDTEKYIEFGLSTEMVPRLIEILVIEEATQLDFDLARYLLLLGPISAGLPTFSHSFQTPILVSLSSTFTASPEEGQYILQLTPRRIRNDSKVIAYHGQQIGQTLIHGNATIVVDPHPFNGTIVKSPTKLQLTSFVQDCLMLHPFTVNQSLQDRYAQISKDFSRLNLDPDYARLSRFETDKTVVYGTLALSICLSRIVHGLRDIGKTGRLTGFQCAFGSPIITGVTNVTPVILHDKSKASEPRYQFRAIDDDGRQLIKGSVIVE